MNKNIKIVNRDLIQWSDDSDIVLISFIGKTLNEPVWLLNHIDVTEGGFSSESIVCIDTEINEYLTKLNIPKGLLKKIQNFKNK